MKYFKLSLLLICVIILVGCASTKRINIVAKPVDKPILLLPEADVLYLKPITWFIITPETAKGTFEALRQQGKPLVLFGVSDEGYENMAINFSDVRAYIQQQHAITKAYQNYYLESEKTIDTANSQIDEANKQVEKINDIIDKPSWYSHLNPFRDDEE